MPLNLPNLHHLAADRADPAVRRRVLPARRAGSPTTNKNLVATRIFIVAAITDWLDGYLARALNQTSAFGAFLDPVADKLMVAAALIVLVQLGRVDAIVALIIIGREIAISALREWMAQIGAVEERGGGLRRQGEDGRRRWWRSRCCSSTTRCSA